MVQSMPRPNVTGAPSSRADFPWSGPSMSTACVGVPLPPFPAPLPARPREESRAVLTPPRGSRSDLGGRTPNSSARIAEVTERTSNQRTARTPSLMTVRVSSDTGSPPCRPATHVDGRRTDDDSRAVAHGRFSGAMTVYDGSVGGPEIDRHELCVSSLPERADLQVPTGHPAVVDANVALGPASEHDARRNHRVLGAIDDQVGDSLMLRSRSRVV